MRFKAQEKLEESRETTLPELSYTSYIYAFGKTFAKVDGIIEAAKLATMEITYFHYDN